VDRETKRKKARLKEDLNFYLDNYKEVSARSERIKKEFDFEINRIVEILKQIGK